MHQQHVDKDSGSNHYHNTNNNNNNNTHTLLYRCKVVTSEAVAVEVRSRRSLSVIMSRAKRVSFKYQELLSAVLGSEFQTAGAE